MRDETASSYRFGPLERRGLIAGWRGGQVAVIAIGLFAAVASLRSLPSGPAIAVAVVSMAVAVAVATWPIAGRTGDEWLPDVTRHGARVVSGRTWRAPSKPTGQKGRTTSPDTGPCPPRNKRGAPTPRRPDRGPFSALRILHADAGNSQAAVVFDAAERTYTAVVPASASGFVLLGRADRDRRVSGWAAALGVLARQGSPVHRIQWVARTLPGTASGGSQDLSTMARHVRDPAGAVAAAEAGAHDVARAASASYDQLVAEARPVTGRHQVLLSMTVQGSRSRVGIRPPGPAEHATACATLHRELASFRRRLSDADVHTAPPLTPRALASVIRVGFSSSRWAWPEECGTTWPWPVASEVLWDAVRMDGTWHATYWVAEWPRTDVSADFLSPLLLAGDLRQAVSVTMEPLSPMEAARQAQQARTADVADAELRRKGGFLHTARRRREEETLADREAELADGHAPFKFSGYVTVSGDSREDLDESCGRIEQSAGQCGMELRRCYGDQQRTFGFTLPLGRGVS
ncbi:MAG: SCO6880 family protein [Acidimicrobiales bacterium]